MYEKESKDKKYRDDPYRAVNFPIDADGDPICPNGKKFHYLYSRPVRGNKYGRTEEFYQCEDCSNCLQKEKCCKCKGNRKIRLNEELTKVSQGSSLQPEQHSRSTAAYEPKYPVGRCKRHYQVEQVIYQSSQKRIKSLEFRNCDDLLWF